MVEDGYYGNEGITYNPVCSRACDDWGCQGGDKAQDRVCGLHGVPEFRVCGEMSLKFSHRRWSKSTVGSLDTYAKSPVGEVSIVGKVE